MDLSLVIPLFNEAESLPELKSWIDSALKDFSYEILFVDDGSTDDSWKVIQELAAKDPETVKGIRFRRNHAVGLIRGECSSITGLAKLFCPVCQDDLCGPFEDI